MRTTALLLLYYGCASYSIVNPFFGLLFFIHITIFRPEALVWESLAFGRLHLITAVVVLGSYLIHRKSYRAQSHNRHQRMNLVLFLCFIIWLLIVSVAAESSMGSSLDATVSFTKILVLCFLFANLVNEVERMRLYAWVVCVSFGMLSLWGFLQGLAGNPRLDTLWPGGSNYIAAQLALVAPFGLATSLATALAWRARLVLLFCTASMVLCSLYTGSRGGFLGLLVGGLALGLWCTQRARARILVALAAIVLIGYAWMPSDYATNLRSLFAEEERDFSAESRLVLWRIALRIWQDYPIAGVGLENFSRVKETYATKVTDIVTSEEMFAGIFNRERYPHGLYFGLMAETGAVGILLFLSLFLRNVFCRAPARARGPEPLRDWNLLMRGAQAGLVGFGVAALFGDFQYIEMLYLQLFFVGALCGFGDLSRHQGTGRPMLDQERGSLAGRRSGRR